MHSPLVSPRAHIHPAGSRSPRLASRLARCRHGALLLLTGALSLAAASAQMLYWDANGNTTGAGGPAPSGTWGTDLFWSTDPLGEAITAGWTSGNTAVFSAGNDATGGYTVYLGANQTAGGLVIEDGEVSFVISNAITLGAGNLTVNSGATLTTDSSLRVSATAGATLTLNGGTLKTINTGSAGSFIDQDFIITLGAAGGTFSYGVPNVLNIVQDAGAPTVVRVTGSGGLTKSGAGVLAVAALTDYQGPTIINDGELRIRTNPNRLPTNTAVTVNSPGILNLNGVSQAIGTLSGNGKVGLGAATLTFGGAADTVFSGSISNFANAGAGGVTTGAGRLSKRGPGSITFTGANGFTGSLTNNEGSVNVAPGAILCDPTADIVVNAGSLNFSNTAQTILTLSGAGGTVQLAPGHTLTVNPTSGSRTYTGTVAGAGSLIKSGAGTLGLAGNNTYQGMTTISAGKIHAQSANALGDPATGTSVASGAELLFDGAASNFTINEPLSVAGPGAGDGGAIAVQNSANITLSGPVTLTGDTTNTVSGTGTVLYNHPNSITAAANQNLVLQGGGLSTGGGGTIAGILSLGTGSLTKQQGGRWTLGGANNYSGGTFVNAGTLRAANTSGSAFGSGPVTVAAGATLGGPGSFTGLLTLNGNLAPGASPGTLNTGSEIWNGGSGYNWEINDATGTQGADPGWDLINITGSLTINATPASKFNLNLLSLTLANAAGAAANFDGTTDFTWTIVKTTTGITGFDPAAFNINTNGFVSPRDATGLFLVETANAGNDLVLRFVRSPAVVTPPAAATVACGGSVPLTVTAAGTAPLGYQWRRNGTPLTDGGHISGATTAALTLNPATGFDSGSYDVVVTNLYGSTTSVVATVTVTDTAPPSIACPSDITVKVLTTNGSSVAFTPVAVDDCATPVISCVPPSGSTFLIGTHTVTCTATDGANTTNCTFLVNVYYQDATNKVVNIPIPDNDGNGLASTLTVASPIGILTDVNVTLHITNGWNGDLYCYLTHSSGFSVLLNRVGRRAGNALGYGDAGFNITLDEEAANGDIHVYRATLFSGDHNMPLAGMLTNAWRPDGRATSPTNVLDTDLRTALLSSFNGVNPNGDWTLFVADLEAGDQSTLVNWGLELCGILPIPASIPTQSPGQTIECSSNLTLTVTTAGTGPLTNQWYKDGMTIAGATNLSLPLNDAHPAASGTYTFVVCNMANCATSAPIVIGVIDTLPPVISACATNQTVCPDAMSQFAVPDVLPQITALDGCSAVALSQSPVAGTLVGPGTHTITITATDASNLTAQCSATLVVQTNTTATALTPLSLCPGSPASFSTVAAGTGPFTYQWYKDATLIPNATNDSFAIPAVANADGGNYCVVVTGTCNSVTNCAALTVFNNVTATALLSVTNGCPGSPVLFATLASGTGPLTYQWTRAGTNIPGANGFSYLIPSPTTADNDTYCVIVSGLCNSVTNCATLSIATPPVISAQPQNQNRPMGNSATFSVTASGPSDPATLAYQWYSNGVAVTGATTSSLTLGDLRLEQNGWSFQVVVSNCAGVVTSAVAVLTVAPQAGIAFDFNTPGQFTNQPYSLAMNNWMNSALPPVVWESATGGVGVATGSGALDLTVGSGDNGSTLLPLNYDFSLTGKTLYASAMIKIKVPTANTRAIQLAFVTATNVNNAWQQVNANNGQGFMSVILQSTTQPAVTYSLRAQHKLISGTTPVESTPVNTPTNVLATNTWYKLVAKFTNVKGPGNSSSNYTVEASLQNMGANGLTPGATVLAYPALLQNNVDLVNASRLFFCVRSAAETGGSDYWDNIYVHTTNGPVFFVQGPQSQSVLHGRPLKLQALVDGDGPYAYQWQKSNSGAGFVNIPNATAWNLFVPAVSSADDQAHYRVVVNGPSSSATSAPALITVVPDALDIVSAGSVDGCAVGIRFDQAVDPVSAANPANYLINGVPAIAAQVHQSPTDLRHIVQDGTRVVVTPASMFTGAFTVSVSGVLDASGNPIGGVTTAAGTAAGLTGEDVNPYFTAPAGRQYSFADGQFEVSGGGADIWNLADSFRYVHRQVSGDFDVQVKIPHVDVMRGATKAGLEVRTSLDPFSPQVLAAVNPQPPARNFTEGTTESAYNVNASSWGTSTTVSYPNVWLRLRRVGNTFLRYRSADGATWAFDGQTAPNPAMPESVYLGLAVCSVANGNLATAWFENYASFAGYPGATIAITDPPLDVTTNAGSAVVLTAAATLTGAPATELAYQWQRSNGIGGWTNVLLGTTTTTGAASTNALNTGALFASDNGAQYRVVVSAPGALSVTSAVATVTVNDAAAPTIVAGHVPTNSVRNIILIYSEPVGASALNTANYAVTNGPGASFGVAGAVFLHGDTRVVQLTTVNDLTPGPYGVLVNGVQDLGGTAIAANTVRLVYQLGFGTGQPFVVELYGGLPAGGAITDLVNSFKFAGGDGRYSYPELVNYSNVFGINHSIAAFPNTLDNYGIRMYSWFVPPTSGAYKFYLRGDDFVQLWMNTNPASSTLPPDAIIASSNSIPPNAFGSPVAEQAYWAFDNSTNTKYLNSFGLANAGVVVTPAMGSSVVTGLRLSTANDVPDRDPMTFVLEGTTGDPSRGPWTLIASGVTGLPTDRFTVGPAQTFPNATAYTSYRLIFPTVRNSGQALMQVSEIELLDAGGVDVTGRGALPRINLTGANANYTAGNSFTNTLVGGQRYFIELRYKETGGGDGGTVAIRTDNTVPAATEVAPGNLFERPAPHAPYTPVQIELYTGLVQANAIANGRIEDLVAATNTPAVVAGLPSVTGFGKHFGFSTNLANSSFDNYYGRVYANFIAPSNGLYKFYIRSDDSAQLWMNTNAVNSTDPAGMSLLGYQERFINVTYWLMAENVWLNGGQRYYMEGRWREGGSGDGFSVAIRSQGDFSTPPVNELLPASMFEMATNVVRYGPVQVAGITPLNPTVNVGESIVFQAVGIHGSGPYGVAPYPVQWLKNGVQVMANALTYTNPPVTAADNGAVFTLVVTNAFSRAEVSSVITVPVDNTPPTLVSAVGSQYQEFVTVTFDGPVEAMSAACLANYRINNGVQVLSVALDSGRRNRVSLRTSPQTPGTVYTVTVNDVKDPAGNVIAANSTINYTAWTWGGCGFLVELFTNITGSAVFNLTTDGKYVNNLPDVSYYTNVFGAGRFAADSGLNNYGARVSAYVQPPSNGLYRFYVRGDDGTMLFMNTNGPDARARVMIARNDGANSGTYLNGLGNGISGASISPIISLTNGTSYYIEALMKEGGGGDHLEVVFRPVDPGTLQDVPPTGTPAAADLNPVLAVFFAAPGNPDAVQLVVSEAPPATLNVRENDLVNLRLVAGFVPPSARLASCFQWQKETAPGSGVFTNIPGAVSPILPTFAASLAEHGLKYRLVASLPAPQVFTTMLNVTADLVGPTLVGASSLDGTNLHLCFSEAIDRASGTAEDTAQFVVNGGAITVLSAQLRTNDERTVVLNLATPVSGQFVVDAGVAGGIQDLAVNFGTSSATGTVQNLLPADVGGPPGAGSSFSCKEGEIDVIAGGADIWGASDQGHMVLRPVCGDFDVWVRLQRLDRAAGDNDGITKAGLMVRESWAPDARRLQVLLEPPASIGGREFYEAGQRPAVAAGTAAWNGGSGNTLVMDRAGIPNGWMRIKRTGNIFEAYRSTDGVNWSLATTNVVNYSNVVYVGVAATAHVPSPSASTTFAEFRDLHLPFPPTILVAPSPADQTVPVLGAVSWTVTASNPPNAGPLTYQWQRNGNPIAGATNATYSIASAGSADAGFYTVVVGNHGGCVSASVTLNVNNGLPVVSGEMLMATQNVASTISAGALLANDNDPEGQPLSMLGVSGSYPGFFNANFEDGSLPAGSALYGTPLGNPGAQVGDDGSGTNKCIHLTDVGNASAFGAYVVEDPAAGKTVNQLHVRWRQRIGGAVNNTLQFNRPGADGMALSWGVDVPAVPVNAAHEDGLGTGLIITFDTWDNGGFEAPGIEIKWRGTALTNRLAFDALSADQGIAKDLLRKDRFVDASLTVKPDGVVTLVYDGMTMSAVLPGFTGIAGGRFAWAGRTGGAFDNHWIDDVSIVALTRETTLASTSPVGGFTNDFNAGLPGGVSLFGTPLGAPTGARVGDDGTGTNQVVHLTDQPNSSAFGALVVPDLAAGKAMNSIDVQWRQLIGGGTNGGTQFGRFGADGMSFSWAADLPTTPVYTAFEEGMGGGLSVTFDTWDSGGLEAPGIEIRWRGARVAFDPIDADQGLAKDFLRKNQLVNARVTVNAAGQATVTYDGRTLTATLAGWTGIAGGRFMWAGRTGGAWDNTWVDDISITGTAVDYGQVSLAGGTVTYTPPTNGCGLDHYYYVASDGQLGGLSVGQVDVQIKESVALPPVIAVCAPNQTYSLTNACTQAAPDLRGLVLASDNCCCLVYSQTPAPGTPLPLGSHVIELVATDTMGLSATCTATVVVQDIAPPQIACPADITAECMSGNSAVVTYPAPVVTDNCSSTVLCLPPSGSSFPSGSTTVTCIAMDPSANSASCQFTVTVVDTTPPVVTCQSNMVVLLGAGLCETTVAYAPPAFVDCDSSIAIVCSPASGSVFPAGTNLVTCSVTDGSANTGTCSFQIAVIEIVAPVIACPADTSVECGNPTLPPATGVASATDNCDTNVLVTYSDGTATEVTATGQAGWILSVAGAPPTSTAGFAAGPGTPPLGSGSLRLAVGADGDSLAQARNTNYHGVRLSHLTELGFRTWVTANNGNGETIYLTLNVDSDNNGTADDLLVFEPEFQSGYTMAVPDQGLVTLGNWQTWDAMRGGWYSLNQPGIMSAGAGVRPLSAYLAANPNARIVNTGSGAGGVRLVAGNGIGGWENFVGSADRFAIGVNGTSTLYDFDDVAGTGYDTIVRTWTAMDDSGNRASCSQVIKVVDTTAPVVACPSNLTLECSLTGGATASFVSPATDACDPAPAVVCAPVSGSVFALGATTVNCVATDSRGNSNACSFTVTVIDTTPPSIVCPAPIVQECAGPGGAPVTFTATASDVCDPSPAVVCVPASGATFAIGTNTVVCTSTDMSTNTATCNFTVIVRDTAIPVLVACALNQTVPANANCEGVVPDLTGQVTATDLCGAVAISQVPLAGSVFTGSLVVTLTVTDLAGNSTNCAAMLTAVDVTVPVIGCPANFTAECATPAGTVVNFTTVATDNCTASPVVTCVPASGTVFAPGTTTVDCVAVDGAGNSNTCSFAVSVVDTTDPTLCSNPLFAQNAGGTNDNFGGVESALPSADLQDVLIGVDLRDFDDAGADEWFAHTFDGLPDDISGAVLRIKLRALSGGSENDTIELLFSTPGGGALPQDWMRRIGTNTLDNIPGLRPPWTAGSETELVLDLSALPNANNTTTDLIPTLRAQRYLDLILQDDTMVDYVVLEVTTCQCGPDIQVNVDPMACGAVVSFVAPVFSDNCDTNVAVACTPPSGSFFGLGTTTVECRGTDDSGNVGRCSFNVTVVEPGPGLQIQVSGANIVVSWPITCASYRLEETTSLNPVITWNTVGAPVFINMGRYTVTLPIQPGNRFFRLANP